MHILCINGKFPKSAIIVAQKMGAKIPEFMETYASSGLYKCRCGCGNEGYCIPSIHSKLIWEKRNFMEIDATIEDIREYMFGKEYASLSLK